MAWYIWKDSTEQLIPLISKTIFNDPRSIPFIFTCISLTFQIVHGLFTIKHHTNPSFPLPDHPETIPPQANRNQPQSRQKLDSYIQSYGGSTLFVFLLARLIGCFVLLSLSVWSIGGCKPTPMDDFNHGVFWKFLSFECPQSFMVLTYAYTSLLSLTPLLPLNSTRHTSTRSNIIILLSAFTVYAYRDLWPLATYTQTPADGDGEGSNIVIWLKIVTLAFTAVVIPLFIPRRYIPINPTQSPNPEQTASIFSRITYTYLDSVILQGSKVRHLGYEQFPPLADDDQAEWLVRDAFPYLDTHNGATKRHLFFRLLFVFRKEYLIIALCIIGRSFFNIAAPVGINRILKYLESGDSSTPTVRPWFWISWLFLGPMSYSICFHWYNFIAQKALVRMEALIRQLVFEHGFRMRVVKAAEEAKNDKPPVVHSKQGGTTGNLNLKDGENLIGKMNNLVTTDLNNIVDARDFLLLVLLAPLEILICLVFLYQVLGWSSFIGFTVIILLLPAPSYFATKIQQVQSEKMKMTDARVQAVTEAVSVLRMIKMFGWEIRMSERLKERREYELFWLWKLKVMNIFYGLLSHFMPMGTMLATFATYTLIMKQDLDASKIFSSMAIFSIMREAIQNVFGSITTIIRGKVSLDRLEDFLQNTELLDSFQSPQSSQEAGGPSNNDVDARSTEIGFKNAIFSWSNSNEEEGSLTPSKRSFKLRVDGELFFKRDCVNLIIGPTGSGKTSILMALLGEMHFIKSKPDSWFNLPREGGVAYAAQESWVQNDTIRNNILFGSPYDEERYLKVLQQCALERDLELFEAGDSTEVGERGLTLSGGQKARVTLARAIYSSSEILLLDDVLAALDVHTASWIIDQCFRGDLVKGRTILLVTHNIALASPIAGFVVSMGVDGRIQTQGTEVALAPERDPILTSEIEHEKDVIDTEKDDAERVLQPHSPADGKLIVAEEIPEGHVSWKSMKLFFSGLGGSHPVFFFIVWTSGILLAECTMTVQTWFLGVWGSQYETHTPSEVNIPYYLLIYSSLFIVTIAFYSYGFLFYYFRGLRASRVINAQLIDSVFGSTLRWLDETPTARIIARCTQDIDAVDGSIPGTFMLLTQVIIGTLTKLGAVVIFTPLFLIPGVAAAVLGLYLGNVYLKTQLSVKREMSNSRSPLLAHFSAAINGLVSIRAYGATDAFKQESMRRLNRCTHTDRLSYSLNRWIGVRIDALGALLTAALACYLVYGRPISAANTGFSLNMAVDVCSCVLWVVRSFNDLEVQANSLERIQGYIDIEHEPKATEAGKPPAAWPTSGDLRVENLSARYSPSGPKILHNLSFNIKSGERIGIVGRTGSGKSSLALALLRCILTEGTVYFDDLPTNKINLDDLRSNITIIPQIPELMSGTLRQNLDPFDQNDDATLNDIIHASGLFSIQEDIADARITLETQISGGGSNLSVGQRQIISLARAMVRESKILILDEATSAIDYKTDSVIQNSLRHRLGRDVTVITIAHRLQTIIDADKIMVLDNGHIVEFDNPKSLLQQAGMLRALVEESRDRDTLYALAGWRATNT
ncbi:multidrug resistance-associated ABC transporter [Phlegmacium glaucopus]|nr:multidrug resistance-associated ABC transporter [Phlegmacium glaucopus]